MGMCGNNGKRISNTYWQWQLGNIRTGLWQEINNEQIMCKCRSVSYNGVSSGALLMRRGISEGSILAIYCSLLYSNDFPKYVKQCPNLWRCAGLYDGSGWFCVKLSDHQSITPNIGHRQIADILINTVSSSGHMNTTACKIYNILRSS